MKKLRKYAKAGPVWIEKLKRSKGGGKRARKIRTYLEHHERWSTSRPPAEYIGPIAVPLDAVVELDDLPVVRQSAVMSPALARVCWNWRGVVYARRGSEVVCPLCGEVVR